MGLDWSTFLLEIVNFLILVWILKRFLYAPVRAAIERRQKRVEGVLAEAEDRRAEADRMRAEYEARKQDWERERTEARKELEQEVAAERGRRIREIEQEIARRQEQAETLDQRRRQETEHRAQEEALALAADFGARLLSRVADQDLETRLVEMVVEDLASLQDEHRQALASAVREGASGVRIRSAYPLGDSQRAALEAALSKAANAEVSCAFEEDADLIAGLRIEAGPLIMGASLRDELRFFAEAAR
jgi:F-type H+-transporting ATPase subunit b